MVTKYSVQKESWQIRVTVQTKFRFLCWNKLNWNKVNTLSQESPSSFAPLGFTRNCSLAYVCPSSVNCLSASSSGTFSEVPLLQLETCPFKNPLILQLLLTHTLDQPYLPQRSWCHQHIRLQRSPSLNDCLKTGPALQNLLWSVLLAGADSRSRSRRTSIFHWIKD